MAWVIFLAGCLLHIPARAGIETQMRMAAPLGENIFHFCSLGTDVKSSPGYNEKKQDAK